MFAVDDIKFVAHMEIRTDPRVKRFAKGPVMQFEGAVIKEQGQTFAVVVVKRHVTDNRHSASEAMRGFARHFPGMPIVLMSQDVRGTPTYFGRRDIAQFMSRVPMQAIPWKRYTFN